MKKAIILGNSASALNKAWGPAQRERLSLRVDLLPVDLSVADLADHRAWLAETEVIFSTWGMPLLTDEQLAMMPSLRAVFYAAGTIKRFAAPLLDRDVIIVSAWAANAVPVAEFTLAQILFSLKAVWQHRDLLRQAGGPEGWQRRPAIGAYGGAVGIVSLGMIGRKLAELLRPFSLEVLAYDPFASDGDFQRFGVKRAGSLEEIFATSDVVTLHAPWLKETEGMVNGALLDAMKANATFINTARGALVNEPEMIEVLRRRPDLTAILDVTNPEPPVKGSALYELPNVILTPHIAGSLGNEVRRMADLMVEEFLAWDEGGSLRYGVDRELMERIS